MGFKSKTKETNQTNICNPFKVGGLIFDSEDDYQLFKDIDRNIRQTVKSVEDGSIDLKEVFNDVKKINVKEIKVTMIQWKKWMVCLKMQRNYYVTKTQDLILITKLVVVF